MSWQEWTTQQARRFTKQRDVAAIYHDDPVGYFEDELEIVPWSRQAELLRDVATHNRVITRSGHKVSKTCSAAGLALWWLETRDEAQALITSPTFNQVKLIVWEELRKRYAKVAHRIGGHFPKDPKTALTADNGNRIFGLSSDQPENIAGISGKNLLMIIDEGSGYDDQLFEVIEGNAAGGAKIVAFGNPTKTSGWFFEVFRGRRGEWKKHHISSEETPNVVSGEVLIPGLATRPWIEEMQQKYGPNHMSHPVYSVRVAGEFAEHASNAVIGIGAVTSAQQRHATAKPDGKLRIGVDVARYGDDETVIQPVRGNYAYPCRVVHGQDGHQVAAHVMQCVNELRDGELKVSVNVDGIGVGASTVDALNYSHAKAEGTIEVFDVQVGSASTDEDHHNLRSQLWFAIAEWLSAGGTIPPDVDLEQELLAPVYTFDVRNRKKVESKEDIKKKIKRSPDRADALGLAIYHPPPPFRVVGLHIVNL